MKKAIFYSLLVFITLDFIFYLMGCFYEVALDISKWSEATRGVTSIFGFIVSLIISFFVFMDTREGNKL